MADPSDLIQILVIDEDRFSRAYLRSTLGRRPKIRITEAESGLRGLEILATSTVDAVIMELVLSDFDGMALLQLIRSHPNSARTHLVISSSHTLEANVRKAIELGVSDYLVKPYQPADIERRLSGLIQRVEKYRRIKADSGGGSDRQRVLVADNDLNFCSFAASALTGQYDVRHAVSSLEILVNIHNWSPDLLLVNPSLRGLSLEFLLDQLAVLPSSHGVQVYLLGGEQDIGRQADRRAGGWLQRTFVPRGFLAAVNAILQPSRLNVNTAASWLRDVEPEIISSVLQVFGMMTRTEPILLEGDQMPEADLHSSLRLESSRDGLSLVLGFGSLQSLGRKLGARLTGMPEEEIDEELLASGIGEVLNVVGGRLLECCRAHGLQLTVGLPKVGSHDAPGAPVFHWGQLFRWEDQENFVLTLACYQAGAADAS